MENEAADLTKVVVELIQKRLNQLPALQADLVKKERALGGGKVLKDKTIVNKLDEVSFNESDNGWWIDPGTYDVMCNEGCDIAANRTAMVRQRSSLLRNGAIIASSIFDPGFRTNNIGTVMIVTERIFIERDARIAQMYFHENNEGELYDGQFQNDKQRK